MRFGEDEVGMLVMCVGIETTARFLGVNANSPEAVQQLGMTLRTAERPSQINHIDMTDKEVMDTNINIALFKHQMAASGFNAGISNIDEEADYE
jgi:hypothetical protein